jgi:hypothetical protein
MVCKPALRHRQVGWRPSADLRRHVLQAAHDFPQPLIIAYIRITNCVVEQAAIYLVLAHDAIHLGKTLLDLLHQQSETNPLVNVL